MPQMNKGGKFIFGKSLIRTDGTLQIPPQAMEEYHIAEEGKVYLFTEKMMDFLKIKPGMELLSIRSSDIAFTMGVKGPLLEKAKNYDGEIPLF